MSEVMNIIDCPQCGRTKLADEVYSCCLDFTPEAARRMYDALVFVQKYDRMQQEKNKYSFPAQLAHAVNEALERAVQS